MIFRRFDFKNFPYKFTNRVIFIKEISLDIKGVNDHTYGVFLANILLPAPTNEQKFICWTTDSGLNEYFLKQILDLINSNAEVEYVTL